MISTKKYNFIFIIQLLLIIGVLGGGGYLVYTNTINKDTKQDIKEEEVIVPDIVELDEEIITVDTNENIVYDGYDVSIRIPKVNNEQGNEINNKIKEDIEEYHKDKDTSIDFDYYVNNDIVSLVIKTINQDNEENYLTYNFNKNDFQLLDNHDLLELKGIKEEDFHGILVNIYEAYLKNGLEEKEEQEDKEEEEKKEETKKEEKKEEKKIDVTTDDYKKTTDKENCSTSLPMYLDQDNHLNVVFNEYKEDRIIKQIYNLNAKKVVER